eukprot:3709525-Pyramimonas_sp.AAC.1
MTTGRLEVSVEPLPHAGCRRLVESYLAESVSRGDRLGFPIFLQHLISTAGCPQSAGVRLPDVEGVVSWSDIEMINGDCNGCFSVHSDGTVERIQAFSESTGRAVSLLPSVESRAPPTALIAGFPMHSVYPYGPMRPNPSEKG